MGLADDWLDIKQVISLFYDQLNCSYNAKYGEWKSDEDSGNRTKMVVYDYKACTERDRF